MSNKNLVRFEEVKKYYFNFLLSKLSTMFDWSGLPETVKEWQLNYIPFVNGHIAVGKFNGKLYSVWGNVGGEPNEYYQPSNYIVANPILGSKVFNIYGEDADCAILWNSLIDSYPWDNPNKGLRNLIEYTSIRLAHCYISINTALMNARATSICIADTENSAHSMEMVLNEIYNGNPRAVVRGDILSNINVNPMLPTSNYSDTIRALMETYQFSLAQFYHSIGINAQYNMKRERLNTSEVVVANQSIDVSLSSMLTSRKIFCEKVNKLFDTNISVDLGEEWAVTKFNTEMAMTSTVDNNKFNMPTSEDIKIGSDKEINTIIADKEKEMPESGAEVKETYNEKKKEGDSN